MNKIMTNAIAEKNIGKYFDCYRRGVSNWPKKIIRTQNGTLCTQDYCGVCCPIEDKGFNVVYFDYIFDNLEE
jgi:hypothetical protein